jgi:hypothetical protein
VASKPAQVGMFCPKCKAEYREGFTRCADCDVALVDRLPLEFPDKIRPNIQLVAVRTFVNAFDAIFAKNVLDGAGIDSEIRGYQAGKYIGFPGGIELLVRGEDAAAADEVLNSEAKDAG